MKYECDYTACWIRYMSSNVYVLIFLLLYSIELVALGLQAYMRIIMFICGAFAVGTRPSRFRICDSCANGGFEKLLKIMCWIC